MVKALAVHSRQLSRRQRKEETTEPADTTGEGTVETPTNGDSADDAQDASKTEIDGGATDTTE